MKHLLCIILTLFIAASCTVEKESHYDNAIKLLPGDEAAAEKAFLAAIAADDNASEAGLQYADLCEKQQEKIYLALYYYRKYLIDNPAAADTEEIKEKISILEKKIAVRLNQKIGDAALDENSMRIKMLEQHGMRQKQWIQDLENENRALRRQLAEANRNK